MMQYMFMKRTEKQTFRIARSLPHVLIAVVNIKDDFSSILVNVAVLEMLSLWKRMNEIGKIGWLVC